MQENTNLQKQEKLFQCPIDEEFVALMVGNDINQKLKKHIRNLRSTSKSGLSSGQRNYARSPQTQHGRKIAITTQSYCLIRLAPRGWKCHSNQFHLKDISQYCRFSSS